MSTKSITQFEFDEGGPFDLAPRFAREEVVRKFDELQATLLGGLLDGTETLALHPRFKQVANEAAGLAWTTEFPLLVFPELFEELARRERGRAVRQQRIRAQSERLMEGAV